MKKSFLLIIFIVFLSCKEEKTTLYTPSKKEINTFISNWHKAAANANYENYFNAMDSISVFVGTDASEVWDKKAFQNYSKPYFDKGKAWTFHVIDRNIYTENESNYIWFDELLDTRMGICRGSGVVKNTSEGLSIKHYVLSAAVPNEKMNELIEIKKEMDSVFIKNLKDSKAK